MQTAPADIDLDVLHEHTVNQRGSGARGAEVAALLGSGRSLAIELADGRSWTLAIDGDQVRSSPGTTDPALCLRAGADAWSDLAAETWSLPGLVFGGRIEIVAGEFGHAAAWEPALQALYFDRPIWENGTTLPVDLGQSFSLDDDDAAIGSFLETAGFALVRGVFDPDEVAAMRADVEAQRAAATPDDKRSWWATDAAGDEHCCRVTYLNKRSDRFAALAHDPRLLRLAALSSTELQPTPDHGDGVSVVIKCPEIVEGLADLPWHRDCGMGGHPILCPGLNLGVQLDPANAQTGQLRFLPGSQHFASGMFVDEAANATVAIDAEPGDVTVHYGHTMHVAPAPTSPDAASYRRTVYVSFHKPAYVEAIPEGQGYNDILFAHGDGRVRSPEDRV